MLNNPETLLGLFLAIISGVLLLAGVIALFCGNRGRRGGALFLKPTDLVSLLEALHCVRRTQLVLEFLDSSPDPP